jgi:hypothetical protein
MRNQRYRDYVSLGRVLVFNQKDTTVRNRTDIIGFLSLIGYLMR